MPMPTELTDAFDQTDAELGRLAGLARLLDGLATDHFGAKIRQDPFLRDILALVATINQGLAGLPSLRRAEWTAAGGKTTVEALQRKGA